MEKSARCGFLHTRLSPSRCQPAALGSAGPACRPACGAPPQGGAPHRANRPHLKIPGTHSGMPGSFLFRFDGRHAGEPLPISTAAAAKGGKLSPVRAFAGRRRSAHLPALSRRTAARAHRAGQTAPSKNPRHSPWNAGDFLSIYSCCTGVTSARRSHGLPL